MAEDGTGDRDRNAQGRPESQRPRDRTGRPLAYDTDETELAEDFEYDTVEEALETGRRLWDGQRYFEAHECLEDVWHHAAEGDEDFWQGVIQVAVACVHRQRGNPIGAAATFAKARARLEGYPEVHHGIDVGRLRAHCRRAQEAAEAGDGADAPGYPGLPVGEEGPVFDPAATATPLTRKPPWMSGGEEDP